MVNGLQHTTLALTWSNGWLDRPDSINQLVLSCPSTSLFSPECIIQPALAEKWPTLYLMNARKWRLRVSCLKRKGLFDPVRLLSYKNQNLAEAQNLVLNVSILVMYPCLSQGKWVSPLVNFQHKFDSVVGGGALDQWKTNYTYGFLKQKFKHNLSELDSSFDNEAESPLPRFIVIESTSSPITNLFLFITEKVISSNLMLISVKKIFLNETLLVELEKKICGFPAENY